MRFVDPSSTSRVGLIARLVRESRSARGVVLNALVGRYELYADLVAAAIIARLPRAPVVLLAEVNWKRGTSAASQLGRRLSARVLTHPRIFWCVLSEDDRQAVVREWGARPDRVLAVPSLHTLTDEDLAAEVTEDGGVFAGGNTLRDYGPLLEAARSLTVPVTIATNRVDEATRATLPAHVTVGLVPHERFLSLLRAAAVVVVPIEGRPERSAGEQTYWNAMALGKLVVVTDTLGVREFVDDRRTGLFVPPQDAAAMRAALDWALDPVNAEQVDRIRTAARAEARGRYGPEHYAARLFSAVRSAEHTALLGTRGRPSGTPLSRTRLARRSR